MQKYYYNAIRLLAVLTFAVPFVVRPETFIFPFIVPKILLFRSIVVLMAATYALLLAMHWKKYRPVMTPLSVTVGLFIVSFMISTFVGVDWYRSFWDNHERMLGLFTLVHYYLYYLILSSVFPTWKEWRPILYTLLAAGTVVMFQGVAQKIDPEYLLNRGSDRVSATLGNAIYYSGYGLFLMFLGSMLFAIDYGKARWLSIVTAGAAALGFIGIFLGGTRGTILGALAGVVTVVTLYVVFLKGHPRVRQVLSALLGTGVVVLALLFAFRQTNFVMGLPGIGRLLATDFSNIQDNTRVMAWGVAYDSWKEHPIFGWGPNNFYYAFNKYYRPEFLRHGWGETWFDNAHNIIMNTLSTQGLFGVLTYLGMFGVAAVLLIRAYRSGRVPLSLTVFATGFLVAHLVHNIFVFENPTSYLYFFCILAFITAVTRAPAAPVAPLTAKSGEYGTVSPVTFVAVTAVALLVIFSTNINPKRANTAALGVIQTLYTAPQTAQSLYERAAAIPSPHQDDIRSDVARTISEITDSLVSAGRTDIAKSLVTLAFSEQEKNQILHPLDIRIDIQQAQLAIRRAELFQDPLYIVAAEGLYERALAKSPKRQQIIYALVSVKVQLGKMDEAVALAESAWNSDPEIVEAWWRLAWVYAISGDTDKARSIVAEARDKGFVFDAQGEQVVRAIEDSANSTST